jgi:hypothetical protein
MGSDATSGPGDEPGGAFMGRLADRVRWLEHEAKTAIAQGDYARAAALIDDAEMLAEDVHGLVDDIAQREADRLLGHAAGQAAAAHAPQRAIMPRSRRGLRLAIGASLAMSLALTEC